MAENFSYADVYLRQDLLTDDLRKDIQNPSGDPFVETKKSAGHSYQFFGRFHSIAEMDELLKMSSPISTDQSKYHIEFYDPIAKTAHIGTLSDDLLPSFLE